MPKTITARRQAILAGTLYLLIIVFGFIAQVFVRDRLVDYANAGVTANNISQSELWFRFGFVSELLMLTCDTMVTVVLFLMLRKVSTSLVLFSTFFRVLSISILSITALSHYAALVILNDTGYLAVFDQTQQHALALLSIKLHGSGYNISLFFFGFHLLFLGPLIVRSGFIPKLLGIMLTIGGACYVWNSLTWFLFPGWVTFIYPGILLPSFLSELSFCVWLLFKGGKLVLLNVKEQ